MTARIGSLFTGTGQLDAAVSKLFNATTVWHAEINPAASKVLAHHYPNVPNLGDITKIDWAKAGDANGSLADIDVICGGFP